MPAEAPHTGPAVEPVRIETVVEGMTCGHCVASVTEEIEALPGVRSVRVDLATGRIEVAADRPIDPDSLRAAVEEAGYRLLLPATR